MLPRVAAVLLLGLFGPHPAAADCDVAHQIRRLNPSIAFDELRGVSVAVAPGQTPAVAFYGTRSGEANRGLWMHRCLDAACSPGTTIKLNANGFLDGDTTVLLRADGRPLIANNLGGLISLYDCADANCRSGSNRVLRQVSNPLGLSATIRGDGRPVLAYVDQFARSVDLLVCADANCSNSSHQSLATYPGMFPPEIDLALTTDHRPMIARTSFGENAPFVDLIQCESPACDAPVVQPIATHYGYGLSVAVRSDGRALLHFADTIGPSKLVTCNDPTCTAPATRTLVNTFSGGMIMGANNLPILTGSTGMVGYYTCETEDCSTISPFQSLGSSPSGSSLVAALGDNGQPVIAWTTVAAGSIHTATCSTTAVQSNGFETELSPSTGL